MDEISERIAAWEAAGLIDPDTADRLREAESVQPKSSAAGAASTDAPAVDRSAASAMFGPGVSIAEVFAYLGGAFLVAAWSSFMARAAGSGDDQLVISGLAAIAAVVLTGLGALLRPRGEAGSRAAGVAFLLASSYVAVAAFGLATSAGFDWPVASILASGGALLAAIALRIVHPAVLTQIGVLSWATTFSASMLSWLQITIIPEDPFGPGGATSSGPDPIILVVASAVWWLATAVVIAMLGLREAIAAESTGEPAAGRRAAISRFWAGLTAVIGLAMAVSRTQYLSDYEYGRVLEPWIGDLALIILCAVLIERAFRRDSTAFIYAAALGLMVALTDFNVSYLSDNTESALLVEGLILLGVGVAADRLRRRVGHVADPPASEALTSADVDDGG